nr:5956_t:CDS:2 [Entrophospora candida]
MNDIRQRKTKQALDEPDPLFIYNFIDEPTKSRRNQANGLKAFSLDSVNLIVLVIVAMIVRLYKISQPTSVVFDEVHFGGFASKYARGRFFMDVHPPLAKLLITFAGLLGGFDGSFDFKEIGKDYLESEVPYVAMRLMPAILGIFLIPISYLTMKYSGFSTTSAFLSSIPIY